MKKKIITGLSIIVLLTVGGAGLILLHRNQAFADPPDTPPGQENSEKVTICHIPPGDPGQAKKMEIPRTAVPAHLAHGDTYGRCFVHLETYQTQAQIEDFRVDEDGKVVTIVTEEKVLFPQSDREFDLTPRRVELDRSSQKNVLLWQLKNGRRSLKYELLDRNGGLINIGEIELLPLGQEAVLALTGQSFITYDESLQGKSFLRKIDALTGTQEWFREFEHPVFVHTNPKFNRILVKREKNVKTILDLETGQTLAEQTIDVDRFRWADSSSNLLGFVIFSNPRKIVVWNEKLNKIQEWEGNFYGPEFSQEINSVISPTFETQIFVGNLNTTEKFLTQSYATNATLWNFFTDKKKKLLLVTGSKFIKENDSATSVNLDRILWIYSLQNGKILKKEIFPSSEFDFYDRFYSSPRIKGSSSKNIIALNFPTQIRIYKYD